MSLIEVTTSHNIVVRFELASVLQRLIASLVDFFILILFTILFAFIVGGGELFYWLVLFPVWTFYHFFWEVLNKGQSPGKMLLRIRVVTLAGRTPLVLDYFTRWIFRMIDVTLTLGTLAIVFISSSGRNQRVGDLMAQTAVVRKRNENSITLSSITELDNGMRKDNEEILYPDIAAYTDDDMLLLKQSIIRYRHHPNESNKEVLLKLADSISKQLRINLKDQPKLKFLDRVLYEYILITR
jgi:uncharacterized RDD family membrane protein YckC